MENNPITPIKRVFTIINSCKNEIQLNTCIKLSEYYTKMIKFYGVINYDLVLKTLFIKIKEKRNELYLANRFKGSIRRRKVKVEETEKEIIKNFH